MTRARGFALAVTAALAAVLAACDVSTPSAGSASTAPTSTGPTEPGMSVAPRPTPTPDDATPAVLDAALLDYLPETVGGVPVTEDLNEAASALAGPELSTIATALDVGLVLDQATGNLVAAHVVRLREGVFDDATFRQWRDSFDEGACTLSGGIVGRAEATIAERTVFVTSCVAEIRTYHVWIEDQQLLISASSFGPDRFGELLMSDLRVPE